MSEIKIHVNDFIRICQNCGYNPIRQGTGSKEWIRIFIQDPITEVNIGKASFKNEYIESIKNYNSTFTPFFHSSMYLLTKFEGMILPWDIWVEIEKQSKRIKNDPNHILYGKSIHIISLNLMMGYADEIK